MHISRQAMWWMFLKDCFTPYRKFSLGNCTKILCHLRIPKQGLARAYLMLLEPWCFKGTGSSWVNPFQGSLSFPLCLPPASLGLAALLHETLRDTCFCHSLQTQGSEQLRGHSIGYSGWGSKCPFSFRAKESSITVGYFNMGKCNPPNHFFQDFVYLNRGEGKEKEGEKHQCVVASHAPPIGDLAGNPGMCPDWESNLQLFDSQACTQSTEPHQPGPHHSFDIFSLNAGSSM